MIKSKTIYNAVFLIGLASVIGIGYSFVVQDSEVMKDEEEIFKTPKISGEESDPKDDYSIYSLEIPEDLSFAGESVPLKDPDIYERMDRELLVNTYWQSNAILLIKRAKKYFPIIEPILKENNVPDDFKYLAVAESGLQQVTSPAGAKGFWQIMKGTGREYGLEINSNVDERYHIEKATKVACEYLKKAKEKFGSWTLAAASYNAGMAGISKQMERQKESEYYNLILNNETERYVFRIIALKEILSEPENYGFNIDENHMYKFVPTKIIQVDTAITDIPNFAKSYGLNYKQFKIHNPWMRDSYLLNSTRKVYEIKIPLDTE
jgi:hypothetical protein